ncbi:MAG: hypothetical protein DRI65_18385 [Chloroflexota bacterium]|nr:MAG: hypothetical protein DRI65_18385 [Chloroflexota bacterium]
MKLVFGIIDREKNQIISMRECLTDILDEWNDLSCDHHRHQVIVFDNAKLQDSAFWGWTRRLNVSKATMNSLLLELETLVHKPESGVHVRKIL